MAVLNLRDVPDDLAHALKVEAAKAQMGVRDYCVEILQKRGGTSGGGAEFRGVAREVSDAELVEAIRRENAAAVSGLSGPGFGGEPMNMEPFRPKVYPRSPDVVFDAVPEIPEAVISQFEKMQAVQDSQLGLADLKSLQEKPKPGAEFAETGEKVRTAAAGRDALVDVPKVAEKIANKIKKSINQIAKEKEFTPVALQRQEENIRREIRSVELLPDPGIRTDPDIEHFAGGHDIKTCKVYGCLMCKWAKGGK